jgi:hypothetical protein
VRASDCSIAMFLVANWIAENALWLVLFVEGGLVNLHKSFPNYILTSPGNG